MARVKKHSSLLAKYTLMYEKKPRSRVFAPLAETYRKIGMIDDALEILKNGIKNHPTYTLGYIVLASCYYDLQNFEMAYNTIRPFVAKNLENIRMQKLFAQTCLNLSHLEEALQTFKYLLLMSPRDSYIADQVKILEDDLLVDSDEEYELEDEQEQESFNEDEWVQVSFNKKYEKVDEELDQWNVEKSSPLDRFKNEIENEAISVKEHNLDDQFYHEEFDNEDPEVIGIQEFKNEKKENEDEKPFITHTLVDLYCKQNHYDKAIEILQNILEIHPDDKVTQKKLKKLQSHHNGEIEVSVEISKSDKIKNLEIIYSKFQNKLNMISEEKLINI
jgi:pentatricopeptide repeat protein